MTDQDQTCVVELPRPETARGLATAGGVVSVVWLMGILAYVVLRWDSMAGLEPNALGDFLAGAFAPLAFLWLVLGFSQQGVELRNNGKALLLQGNELRSSVEQQRQLVQVTREQLAFESNRISVELERAKRLAQPRFDLQKGSSSSIPGPRTGREQTFYLVNHGKSCTRVVVKWDGKLQVRADHLTSGSRMDFRANVFDDMNDVIISVSYLDEMGDPGEKNFALAFELPGTMQIFSL